ncbi:hypothetical protein PGTUg99_011060 [Puccinia graminis f. sp. tritici]|uniref:Uncharacterized protein n=1 Tax=Puccinia graminis f. sp. tritici TaxID=56615 RepID=A0A5B0RLY7_PUCGR|nr:hypothetical protein PGTUg99_011060 [Puccinia graminis f. sp. tritici]
MAHPGNPGPTPASTPAHKHIGGCNPPGNPYGTPHASGSVSNSSSALVQSEKHMSPTVTAARHPVPMFTSSIPSVPPGKHLLQSHICHRHNSAKDGEVSEPPFGPCVGNIFGRKGPKRASELNILKEAGKQAKSLP